MTWIVATLVIVGILFIFIYVSVVLANAKSVDVGAIKTNVDQISNRDIDWIGSKNEMAFSREGSNKNKIEVWIDEKQIETEE